MSAISGTRRSMKEMADGTIRVQVDIDPACRSEFLKLFPSIDMPVALAPLKAEFEQQPKEPEQKGGELAKLAGIFCGQPEFWEFCGVSDEEEARTWILRICDIKSRKQLDHNVVAAYLFHEHIRKPYVEARK